MKSNRKIIEHNTMNNKNKIQRIIMYYKNYYELRNSMSDVIMNLHIISMQSHLLIKHNNDKS